MHRTILVVDDHESVLSSTVSILKQRCPSAEFLTASAAEAALKHLKTSKVDLAVIDLSIPEKRGDAAQPENGIRLLRNLMEQYPTLNIVVQSAHVKTLIRLKPAIATHEGGFTIADKSLPMQEMLVKVDWALQGVIYTPEEMRTGLEVKPEWIEVLKLAFQEGLQDKAIAERMNVAERTVRNYWTKIQDALLVYPSEGKNIRIQTQLQAREKGLID
jgi:DNA-binding NarL/FixJ family response regulator